MVRKTLAQNLLEILGVGIAGCAVATYGNSLDFKQGTTAGFAIQNVTTMRSYLAYNV